MTIVTLEEDGDDLLLPIPQEVLDQLNLKEGDTLLFSVDEKTNHIILTKKDDTTNRKEIS
jgi:bifunctional DNA-binding transcriptional regulator/antitoxin component of YhaV-PrlF toxin-antitoxin module